MTVRYSEDLQHCVVEIEVDGRVGREDFDAIAPRLEAAITACGTIRLIEIVRRLDGVEASLFRDGLKLDMRVLTKISHCAVVGDIGWLSPVAKAAGAIVSTRLRTFPLAREAAARDWIANAGAWSVGP